MDETLELAKSEKRNFNSKELRTIEEAKSRVSEIDRELQLNEEGEQRNMEIKKPLELRSEKQIREDNEKEERLFVQALKEGRATGLAASANGVVIPTSIANRVWEKIMNISPLLKMATRYNVNGNLVLPYHDFSTAYTVGFVTELTAITANATNFSGITLSNKIVAALTLISKSLVNQADIDIVPFVVSELAMAIALFLEKEIIQNPNAKFTNTLKTTVVNTFTTATTLVIDPAEVVKLINMVPAPAQANAAFIMAQSTYSYLMQLKDNTGHLLFNYESGIAGGFANPVPMLLGKPVYFSDSCDAIAVGGRQMYFGDFSNLVIKQGQQMTMQVLQERFADQYAIGVIGSTELDCGIPIPATIACMIGK